MKELTVRPPEEGEIAAAAATERACLSTAWSADEIIKSGAGIIYLVALCGEKVVGTVSARVACDECELINLAVDEAHRRRGIASALLSAIAEKAAVSGAKKIFLEVADGNAAARALYGKHGFRAAGRRKNFYRGEDALIMEKTL